MATPEFTGVSLGFPLNQGAVKLCHSVHCVYIIGGLSVKACITSMASGIDTCDLEFYFETICEMMCDGKVKVLAPLLLGSGKAEIVLKGLTVEGIFMYECTIMEFL